MSQSDIPIFGIGRDLAGVTDDPIKILRERFGYRSFRPGQEEIVRAVIAGRDALGILPTGGGKSLCYQVPAIALRGLSIVVTPIISLMEDQVRRALELGMRARHMSSNQPAKLRTETLELAEQDGLDLLFVAPERLGSEAFSQLLSSADIRLIVVDEAHCISEWGHDFRPSYRMIGRIRSRTRAPLLALTATATPDVQRDIASNLGLVDPRKVVRSFDRSNLSWQIRKLGRGEDRIGIVHSLLGSRAGSCIVYGATRRIVEEADKGLRRLGHRVETYHAGMSGSERSRTLEVFLGDECRIVCATNAFGMGIDKPDVRTVVHLNLPTTLEAYYQEAGRAGRDGEPALCVALYSARDRGLRESFVESAHPDLRRLRHVHRVLLSVSDANCVSSTELGEVARLAGVATPGAVATALAALERTGAIHPLQPLPEAGTIGPAEVSYPLQVGVTARADFAWAASLRRAAIEKLAAVDAFACGRRCRRAALLRYFGESSPRRCGACDRCRGQLQL